MPDSSHIMPNPIVVPILWGHDYVAYPQTAKLVEQMISDLVTGPFMNGLAQYGIRRGSTAKAVIIDDTNPPATVTYYDRNNELQDDITKALIGWIKAGLVPAPPSNLDINWMYLIIPPSETTPQTYNNAGDPIGNGIQGWHNEGVTNPGPPPTYYWAIVKTNDCGSPSAGVTFVNNFAQKVAHELVEQFADRNGTFEELGDPCLNSGDSYRGWQIQKYWSDWDNGCIRGDQPPPMPTSFQTVDNYSHIFVLGTDGKLWLEQSPFGTVPPARQQVDGTVFTFQALDNQTVFVLGTDGNLWLEHGPFGKVPPPRQQVDGSVQAFQALDSQTVLVLGTDGNLWLESAPFGNVPPSRVQVDGSVRAFHAVNENYIFVLGRDGKLWLEEGPFGHVPPTRQQVDGSVRAFQALGEYAFVWVLGTDGKLWLEFSPFGSVPPNRQQIDANVLAFQPIDLSTIVVLGLDGKLWLEHAPFGTVPPVRQQIDGNVMEFRATGSQNLLVLGTDGKLWLEKAPFGTVPPARQWVDATVA
jgi:hypothetical protein